MEQLLTTKLYIPPPRLKLVSRPRLIEKINAGLHRNLTLISAPAGFGKTTLVSEWVEQVRAEAQNDLNIAWLSLDDNDNDPVRFLAYLIAAIQQTNETQASVGKDATSLLKSPQTPQIETVLTSLINDLTTVPNKIVLVLEDYHLITQPEIDEAINFLLDHLPHQLHLLINTRIDPQLPLARLRARGRLSEIRATDLRFTIPEAVEFFNQVMGLSFSEEAVTTLETRTEGWIAGLQLAAITMQGREDTDRIINSFTGSNRLVLDYLIEEVLNQQSESTLSFLLKTSILNQLTGPLCSHLTGQPDGQATLEDLERANLFIIPLDDERRWYRYHHLFGDLLRQRLNHNSPNQIDELHAKAEIWYEDNDIFEEAIYHAFARNDFETATRLIETGAEQALKRSDLKFILKWVDRLPENTLETSPWIFVYYCWALLISGQVNAAVPKLQDTDWVLESISDENESNKQKMAGYIAGLKALLSSWKRDYENGIEYANQAVANLPKDNWIRGYCAIVMGVAHWGQGNLEKAIQAFTESASVGKASGNTMVEVSGACNLAYSYELAGQLQQALRIFQNTFQSTEKNGEILSVAGYIHVEIGRVYYELNELELAEKHLREGIRLCKRLADGRAERIGHYLLGRVQLANGDPSGAISSMKKGDQADSSPGTTFDLRGGEFLQFHLWLHRNSFREIEQWLQEKKASTQKVSNFKENLNKTMHARAMLALNRENPDSTYLTEPLALLDDLLEKAETNGWGKMVIEIIMLQALCYHAMDNTEKAIPAIERALNLAEPEGYIRIFVDEGHQMAKLLYQLLNHGTTQEYIHKVLAAFGLPQNQKAKLGQKQTLRSDLIEPLSEREIEVIDLLAKGLSNKQIAARLYLSLNTIKAHNRNIFAKLDVTNRTQAVSMAKALGLLDTER